MKTIVINTSKEAKRTKLDVLFNAPFDQHCLLWYDSDLAELGEIAGRIKQALITDTDTVERDYQLIVLVDLYAFPQGNETNAVRLYKALLVRYIGVILVNRLYEYNLLPVGTSVYFADSAKYSRDVDLNRLDNNPTEQEQRKNRQREEAREDHTKLNENGDMVEAISVPETKIIIERSAEERMMMELFSWTEDLNKDEIHWELKTSISDDTSLDFSKIFKDADLSIQKSHVSARILEIALEQAMTVLQIEDGSWDTTALVSLPFLENCFVRSLTCKFERDNEQTLIEGFFNVFANVFLCVQTGRLLEQIEEYSRDKIADVLLYALNKYEHFSSEKNIPMTFAPVAKIFEKRELIVKNHKQNARLQKEFGDKDPNEVADLIMQETASASRTRSRNGGKMRSLDRVFYELVEDIFDNYDPEIIKSQNDRIIKGCLTALWSWRDKNNADAFASTVDSVILKEADKENNYEPDTARETLAFIQEEYEREHAKLITEITDVEHRLAVNQNILLETKNLILKYSELKRKGKTYLISFVGACIAVVVSVLPFVSIQLFPADEKLIPLAVTLGITAGFAALYATASGIYMGKINKKKRLLKDELAEIKSRSEQERRTSIAALYRYYSDVVVRSECYSLLWNEILRRDRENAVKCVKRNNHIKRLKMLSELVERFRTMLKINTGKQETAAKDAIVKRCEDEGLVLRAEESFYSRDNQKVYSILSEEKTLQPTEREEEGKSLQ